MVNENRVTEINRMAKKNIYLKIKNMMALLLVIALGAAPLAGCKAAGNTGKQTEAAPAGTVNESGENKAEAGTQPGEVISLTDAAGRNVILEKPAERIVSGYYITTSLLIALGLEEKTVGIEAKADKRPIYSLSAPEFLELPSVGTSKDFDLEGCAALKPDLVILPKKLAEQAGILTDMGICSLVVNPESQEELEAAIENIARATGTEERADELLSYYGEKVCFMDEVREKGNARRASEIGAGQEAPKIYIAGTSNILRAATGNMYQNSMIQMAGGENAMSDLMDAGWADISYEKLIAADPDLIVVIPEAGYSKEEVMQTGELELVSAVKKNQVYEMPSAFEAWDSPVPSAILGNLWLTSIVNEEEYPFEEFQQDVRDFYKRFYEIEAEKEKITK